jgi:alanine racemase
METQAFSTWLEVDLGAIKHNIQQIKNMTRTKIMAVIKANGYGHGVQAVARAAEEAGSEWVGVARIEEAINLRNLGITTEIMVLGYTPPVMVPDAIHNDIHVAIYDTQMASAYQTFADNTGKKLKAHLKVETGMGRLGMLPRHAVKFLENQGDTPNIEVDGIFTHFARADEPDSDSPRKQLRIFKDLLEELAGKNLRPEVVHAANSAAVMNFPEAYFDMVRPGIAILGLAPSPGTPLPASFKRALTWKARLTSVRVLPSGHGVSYGSVYVTSGEERIGVIPVGYGDGFRREPNQQVLVRGKRVDIVGRVCMDQSMLQLDSVQDAKVGDEVVLLGEQGDESITAGELAARWGTLNYEVVCGLADRLPRLYFES